MDGILKSRGYENCALATVMICSELVISSAEARMSCRAQIQPSNKFLLIIFTAERNQNRDWEVWVLTDNRHIWVKN